MITAAAGITNESLNHFEDLILQKLTSFLGLGDAPRHGCGRAIL
jgi:hypothetical protein